MLLFCGSNVNKLQALQVYFKAYSFLHPVFVAGFSMVFVSCSFFVGDKVERSLEAGVDNANFIVEELRGSVVATRVNGLPEEIQLSYTACFRDFIHPDNTLQNSQFKIHFFEDLGSLNQSADLSAQKEGLAAECSETSSFLFSQSSKVSCIQMRTDASGCLNWTEVYPYRPVDKSAWFQYARAFEGTGGYQGMLVIPMAVNPWLALDPSGSAIQLQLVDLRYHSIDPDKLVTLKDKDKEVPQCRYCSENKNTVDCKLCERKKKSLSAVIDYFDQHTRRPLLWVSRLTSNINQEHLFLERDHLSKEHLNVLEQFKVCHSDLNKDNCDPPGRFLKVRLKIPLKMKVENYRDEEELLSLTRGNYSVKGYLFLSDNDEQKEKHIVLHRDMKFISTSLVQGANETSLSADFYLHMPYEHYGLSAFLALKVQAEGELKSFFRPFEGVFPFPDKLSSVIGRNSLELENEVLSFYKKPTSGGNSFISSYNLSGSWLNLKQEGFRRASWDVKLNRLRFSDISIKDNHCPTIVDRTVRYVGEVCIIDPLTNKVVPNTGITIQRQDVFFDRAGFAQEGEVVNTPRVVRESSGFNRFKKGTHYNLQLNEVEEESYVTDTQGCLQWTDEIYHRWYDREKYFVRKMIFSKKEWGFEGERMIAINPWHWGFVFFQDVTQLGSSAVRTVAKKLERPQIVLHDFRSLFPDLIYTIDRWLGINLFQNLLFLFRVRVDRPDNVSVGQGGQRPPAMDVRRGYYFLRFVLVKSHTEETGGQGNQVVNDHTFREGYSQIKPWNVNTGWKVNRNGQNVGQMMNSNLEYITHFDTYVQVRDSVVNAYTNLLFSMDEFIFIGSNNRLIVQVLPTDPQYYVYYPNTCEVDPTKSTFVPFPQAKHELISRPFMGTFVPSDQRNWNIFRVLEYMNLGPDNAKANGVDIMSLNLTKDQLDQFIEYGKKHSREHALFKKLHSHLNVETNNWSRRSTSLTKNLTPDLEKIYWQMSTLLEHSISDDKLSDFDETKNKISESVEILITTISTILQGARLDSDKVSLEKIRNLFFKLLQSLNQTDLSAESLHEQVKQSRKEFIDLLESSPTISLSSVDKQQLLQNIQDKTSSKWFKSNIVFPEEPDNWSSFNMNLFAKDEGLKVISMDDRPQIDKFLQDLNKNSHRHNMYRKSLNSEAPSYKERAIYPGRGEGDSHEDIANQYKEFQQNFWNNFELMEGSDYYTAKRKVRRMHLPQFSEGWLDKVLTNGVHRGSLETPEVMTFLHSMCGFWFDKFYTEYLEEQQLKTIFDKHLEHFQYYKGTLDYLAVKGHSQQHSDLYEAMKQFNLLSVDKEDFTFNTNPFPKPKTGFFNLGLIDQLFSSEEEIQEAEEKKQNFSLTESLFRASRQVSEHPYYTCINNPLNFFHLEKKIIVGDIGSGYSDLKYEYGLTKSFNLQRAFDYAYSASWSFANSFGASIGTGFTFLGGGGLSNRLNPLKKVTPLMSYSGVSLKTDWDTKRSESDSNRRQQSLRFSDESLYLQVNHSAISIRLKNYRQCLVIRPQNLAFEAHNKLLYNSRQIWIEELADNFIYQIPYIKSGLLICSEDLDADHKKEPFYITEDYFYLYQLVPGDRGQFQNPLSFRNRPFVITVRGVTEMEKITFLIHSFVEANKEYEIEDYDPFGLMTNPYNTVSKPAEGTRAAVKQAKIWDKTGFYPGVYNMKYDDEHYFLRDPTEKDKGFLESFGNELYKNNPFSPIRFDNTLPVYDRRSGP